MLIQANALQLPIASETVQCVVTSPPYWGLRDYGTARWEGGEVGCEHLDAIHTSDPVPPRFRQCDKCGRLCKTKWVAWGSVESSCDNCNIRSTDTDVETRGIWSGVKDSSCSEDWTTRKTRQTNLCKCGARRIDSQLGLEPTPEAYVANMVAVFREVWRVLKNDGIIFVNLGDSYAGNGQSGPQNGLSRAADIAAPRKNPRNANRQERLEIDRPCRSLGNLKPKDVVGIPWMVAFALRADGWYLRSDIIWHKPNPMPESVTDRPTKAHEYLFLLAKGERYFYDAEAIAERSVDPESHNGRNPRNDDKFVGQPFSEIRGGFSKIAAGTTYPTRNRRTVWSIATQPYSGAHFATFPEKLVEPCILAGSRPGDYVLDPFVGSGTVIRVATRHQRKGVGTDLNLAYLREQAKQRTRNVQVQMAY